MGFNHHVGGNLYVGVEASASILSVDGRIADSLAFDVAGTTDYIGAQSQWALAIGPRIGFDLGNLMPFISGGYAIADSSTTSTALASLTERTLKGWYLGFGFEYRIQSKVSLRVDYARYRFATQQYDTGTYFSSQAAPASDTVRVGVNYYFGGGTSHPVAVNN